MIAEMPFSLENCKNIDEVLTTVLGRSSGGKLSELALDSNCGAACMMAIAATWLLIIQIQDVKLVDLKNAFKEQDIIEKLIDATIKCCLVYYYG